MNGKAAESENPAATSVKPHQRERKKDAENYQRRGLALGLSVSGLRGRHTERLT
jgi:hypothetical protein